MTLLLRRLITLLPREPVVARRRAVVRTTIGSKAPIPELHIAHKGESIVPPTTPYTKPLGNDQNSNNHHVTPPTTPRPDPAWQDGTSADSTPIRPVTSRSSVFVQLSGKKKLVSVNRSNEERLMRAFVEHCSLHSILTKSVGSVAAELKRAVRYPSESHKLHYQLCTFIVNNSELVVRFILYLTIDNQPSEELFNQSDHWNYISSQLDEFSKSIDIVQALITSQFDEDAYTLDYEMIGPGILELLDVLGGSVDIDSADIYAVILSLVYMLHMTTQKDASDVSLLYGLRTRRETLVRKYVSQLEDVLHTNWKQAGNTLRNFVCIAYSREELACINQLDAKDIKDTLSRDIRLEVIKRIADKSPDSIQITQNTMQLVTTFKLVDNPLINLEKVFMLEQTLQNILAYAPTNAIQCVDLLYLSYAFPVSEIDKLKKIYCDIALARLNLSGLVQSLYSDTPKLRTQLTQLQNMASLKPENSELVREQTEDMCLSAYQYALFIKAYADVQLVDRLHSVFVFAVGKGLMAQMKRLRMHTDQILDTPLRMDILPMGKVTFIPQVRDLEAPLIYVSSPVFILVTAHPDFNSTYTDLFAYYCGLSGTVIIHFQEKDPPDKLQLFSIDPYSQVYFSLGHVHELVTPFSLHRNPTVWIQWCVNTANTAVGVRQKFRCQGNESSLSWKVTFDSESTKGADWISMKSPRA